MAILAKNPAIQVVLLPAWLAILAKTSEFSVCPCYEPVLGWPDHELSNPASGPLNYKPYTTELALRAGVMREQAGWHQEELHRLVHVLAWQPFCSRALIAPGHGSA